MTSQGKVMVSKKEATSQPSSWAAVPIQADSSFTPQGEDGPTKKVRTEAYTKLRSDLSTDFPERIDVRLEGVRRDHSVRSSKKADEVEKMRIDYPGLVVDLPKPLYNEDEPIAWAISTLTRLLKMKLVLLDTTKYSLKDSLGKPITDFWVGFALGVSDSINLQIKSKTDMIEHGRAASFAIRVRGYFRKTERLGLSALRKNQLFFGNDPRFDRRTGRLTEQTILDTMVAASFTNKSEGDELKAQLVSLLERVDLSLIEDEKMINRIIETNLLPLEQILTPLRRKPFGDTRPRKQSDIKRDSGKLPEKISQSPLLSKDELEKINGLTSTLWSSLSNIQKDYAKEVMSSGFDVVRRRIREIINLRWEVLTSLAQVTTRRLRKLKGLSQDPRLQKRRITPADREMLLESRGQNRTNEWNEEVSKIIKPIISKGDEELRNLKFPQNEIDIMRNITKTLIKKTFESPKQEERKEKPEEINPFELLSYNKTGAIGYQPRAIRILTDPKLFDREYRWGINEDTSLLVQTKNDVSFIFRKRTIEGWKSACEKNSIALDEASECAILLKKRRVTEGDCPLLTLAIERGQSPLDSLFAFEEKSDDGKTMVWISFNTFKPTSSKGG